MLFVFSDFKLKTFVSCELLTLFATAASFIHFLSDTKNCWQDVYLIKRLFLFRFVAASATLMVLHCCKIPKTAATTTSAVLLPGWLFDN